MGLFRKKIKNPVPGTAQIVSCTMHSGEGVYQNCRLQLVVHVEGWAAYSAELHQILPRKKWPQPGLMVPVIVSQKDPQKLKIDTDAMPSNRDRAREIAEQQAGWSNQAPQGSAGSPQVHVVGDLSSIPAEKLERVEQMLGMDLDGDGQVGSARGVGGVDRIAQLERLAKLHATGALTDAEFAAEKARLLDDR